MRLTENQIDGLITLPVAIYGFLLFPDTPRRTQAPYLNADERALAISRVPDAEEKEHLPLNFRFLIRVLTSWQWWGFVVLWVIAGETESFSSNSLISLYLQKKGGYSVSQLNNYPTGVPAVGIISTLFWATLTDYYGGKRYLVGYFIFIVGIVTSVMILADGSNHAVSMGAYYLAGTVYACQAYDLSMFLD
jgi:ACS family pantothenate transporter-like MFS transporter